MLRKIYFAMYSEFGPQHWWPAESPFEVLVGAILTQQTAWTNVEKAISNLKKLAPLTPELILSLEPEKLRGAIKPSGYFNQKAERLKHVVKEIEVKGGLEAFLSRPTETVRSDLLAIKGIGKETADSIMLYAGRHPVFVVDAYTFRMLGRLNMEYMEVAERRDYDTVQALFSRAVDDLAKTNEKGGDRVEIAREYHALIVELGKRHCRGKKPRCHNCPLSTLCAYPL